MINTKKIIALGIIAVAGVSMVSTTTASAAVTGGGSTTVSYVPGQSTGGDGSTVADWTVDYPKAAVLNDKSTSVADGVDMTFKLLKTVQNGVANTPYDGNNKVKIQIGQNADANGDGFIKLKKGGSAVQENVTMGLALAGATNTNISVKANQPTDITTLGKTDPAKAAVTSANLKAYLKNTAGATEKAQYSTSLTWIFTQN